MATLFEAVLFGLSIQALDGIGRGSIDAAVTHCLKAWDANGVAAPLNRA